MSLTLITPPAADAVALADLKAQLGISGTSQDALLAAVLKGAIEQIDGAAGWLGRALITQIWELALDDFGCDSIRIPLPPFQEIVSVKYTDPAGSEQTLGADKYSNSKGEPALLYPSYGNAWPAVRCQLDAVRIQFKCGYGNASDAVPAALKNAIVLQANYLKSIMPSNLFLSRDEVTGIGVREYIVSQNADAVISKAAMALASQYRVY